MLVDMRRVGLACLVGALLALTIPAFHPVVSPASAQENACAAQDKRQACSVQCCGRKSCPPSCEVDCVKACVDACASPAAQQTFSARLRALQIRCGNKAVK